MVNSDSTRLTPDLQTPTGAGGKDSPHYADICEVCGKLRPGRYVDPDSGPILLCRRCAYKLGYIPAGGKDGKR